MVRPSSTQIVGQDEIADDCCEYDVANLFFVPLASMVERETNEMIPVDELAKVIREKDREPDHYSHVKQVPVANIGIYGG